jgi:membrane-associated protease RseP (regulator of RpoE activity)
MASDLAFVQAPFSRATPAQQQLGSCRLHTSTFLGPAARLRPTLLRAAPARRVRRAPPTAALPAIVAGVAASAANIAPVGVSIAILGSVITWHEFGHLQAAKLQGIRVKNFSIGFGPTLFEREGKDGTTYTLRLLPLGGFVAFPDNKMVDEETGEVTEALDDDPDLLQNRPLLDRAIVISAGVIANLVMAYAALLISTGVVGSTVFNMSPGVVIASVVDAGGPAAKANIQPGDVVLAVDGKSVESSLESATTVAGKIRSSGGRTMSFHILRDGKEFDKRVNPNVLANGDSVVGVQLVPNGKPSRERPSSVPMALRRTNEDFVRIWRQTWSGMKSIVTNFGESSRNLSGPIGMCWRALVDSILNLRQGFAVSFCCQYI